MARRRLLMFPEFVLALLGLASVVKTAWRCLGGRTGLKSNTSGYGRRMNDSLGDGDGVT